MDKLQWGNRKRLRCVKLKDSLLTHNNKSEALPLVSPLRKKITSRAVSSSPNTKQTLPLRLSRELGMNNNRSTSSSPEKEDRYYTTRGSLVVGLEDNRNRNMNMNMNMNRGKLLFMECSGRGLGMEDNINSRGGGGGGFVWPKLYVSLSSKEKEEDFMAMKGCKLPQRPKKRAKLIQRSLLLVSPGAWLSDLCHERYEVREKKSSSKKRPRGLKAMGNMESDSE